MVKCKYETEIGYHFQDVLESGLCFWCGSLATNERYWRDKKVNCCEKNKCRNSIDYCLKDLEKD